MVISALSPRLLGAFFFLLKTQLLTIPEIVQAKRGSNNSLMPFSVGCDDDILLTPELKCVRQQQRESEMGRKREGCDDEERITGAFDNKKSKIKMQREVVK